MTDQERRRMFDDLYAQYDRRVLAYCTYVTGDRDQANDVFQEVFVKVYMALHTLRDTDKAANWLFRIARNECLNSLKVSRRNEKRSVDIDNVLESTNLSASNEGYSDDMEHVRKALEKISPEQREALLLAEFEGFSLKEIADMTGTTLSNVKVRIHRAKQKLQTILQPILNYYE
jgi:RNA polymerase sigma-70 factor (ECF subfamily)